MENLIIRKATINDLESLLRFEQDLISTERFFDDTLQQPTHYYDLQMMMAASHIQLLVAETPTRLVGCGYARIENAKPYLKHTKHAYLGFMYVVPEYRGKGVNKQIIEALEEWSLEQHITEWRLDVYFDNSPAIKAYEKAGFQKHLVCMRKGISFIP